MLYYIYYIDPRMAGQLSPMCYCLQRPVLLAQEKEKPTTRHNLPLLLLAEKKMKNKKKFLFFLGLCVRKLTRRGFSFKKIYLIEIVKKRLGLYDQVQRKCLAGYRKDGRQEKNLPLGPTPVAKK